MAVIIFVHGAFHLICLSGLKIPYYFKTHDFGFDWNFCYGIRGIDNFCSLIVVSGQKVSDYFRYSVSGSDWNCCCAVDASDNICSLSLSCVLSSGLKLIYYYILMIPDYIGIVVVIQVAVIIFVHGHSHLVFLSGPNISHYIISHDFRFDWGICCGVRGNDNLCYGTSHFSLSIRPESI